MSRVALHVLTILVAILAVGLLNAADAEESTPPQAVKGTLTLDNGKLLVFSIPEGGGIRLKNEADGTTYRLIPQRVGKGKVKFSVIDAQSDQVLEVFRLDLDGEVTTGTTTPFSLSLTGIAAKAPQCASKSAPEGLSEFSSTEAECCINCGGDTICCEPSAGWCCDLQCYNPGESCSACSSLN